MSVIIYFFLLFLVSHSTPLSFDYASFDPSNREIRCEGGATFVESAIQLTPNQIWTTGHARCVEPMHLWDKATGSLADFKTNFSFAIDSLNNASHADGIAFFMAPLTYHMPVDADGAGIGLASGDDKFNSSANPFVSVEFDTYHNIWDQENDHVGININSVRSIQSMTWYSSPMDEKLMNTWIDYNSTAKILSVVFTGIKDAVFLKQELYYEIDLRDHLPEWVNVGFASATGMYSEIHLLHSWHFSSNLQINTPSPAMPSISPGERANYKKLYYIGGAVSLGVVLILMFLYLCKNRIGRFHIKNWFLELIKNLTREKRPAADSSRDVEFQNLAGAMRITYSELARATDNFAAERKVGEGVSGVVYRGSWNGEDIAVKKFKGNSGQEIIDYESEAKVISQLRHRHLVKLIGWCHESAEYLLAYEYIPNGTLESHLFNRPSILSCENRYKICREIASSIHYLHEEYEQCVLHRDVKLSNIMLKSNLEAKLEDFCLARFVEHESGSRNTAVAGTLGYMAPEYFQTGRATKESDVFSFGVVVLEIACRRRPMISHADGREVPIREWVSEFEQNGRLLEAADDRLRRNFDEDQMKRLLDVGLRCANPDSASRPSIRQALDLLPPLPSTLFWSVLSDMIHYITATFGGSPSRNPGRHDDSSQFASSASLARYGS
ncbi:L-type lectin-domain containing receptor kinase IX.1-like [Tripterygium wilfordii]|uniref:L-type lectin-domain containing receptor kinase IX.1-like n=1 Tax=Tripterygium wilfordii TaxID=458696 RepID=UPI0018F82D62|nr:L-type lectin-domain containing receptor kinase IX.1-like [Tripterygium wilfordii]